MILSFDSSMNAIKHFDNILSIHNNQSSIIRNLTAYNPLFAGGYPMALLFAPRSSSNLRIKSRYYSDYDMYFPTEYALNSAISYLDQLKDNDERASVHRTENAWTYILFENNIPVTLQVVKMLLGSPEEVLSTFDFKNCAIGFSPLQKKIHLHHEAPKFHSERKLDILHPWMIENINDIVESNVIVQLMRFKKYCDRWQYSLSKNSFDKLMQIYGLHPDITVSNKQRYLIMGGAYNRQTERYETITGEQNIWSVMSQLFTDSYYWKPELDTHRRIDFSRRIIVPNDENNDTDQDNTDLEHILF